MNQALAQLLLTVVLLTASIVFVLLKHDEIAIALVGAVLGQGVSITVQTAVNGKGGS